MDINDIMIATQGGKDILLAYYPHIAPYFTSKRGKMFSLRKESAPSAKLLYDDNMWKIIDFGDEGHPINAIEVCMKNEGLSYGQALYKLSERFGVNERKSTTNKPHISTRAKHSDEVVGTRRWETYSVIPDWALRVMGKEVTNQHCTKLNWALISRLDIVCADKVITKESTESYPIFVRTCIGTQDEQMTTFYKFYEPLAAEKKDRFRYYPEGGKPKGYINGYNEALQQYHKNQADKEDYNDSNKLDYIAICSGERDALNMLSMGIHPIWFNSETYMPTDKEINNLSNIANQLINVPDIDETGIKRGKMLALEHPEIITIWLPDELKHYRDHRGNPRKDLKDWCDLGNGRYNLDNLIRISLPAKFWYTRKQKDGSYKVEIDTECLHYFLFLQGFGIWRSKEDNSIHYVHVDGYKVTEVNSYDIKSYLINWSRQHYLSRHVRNAIKNSNQFGDSLLESMQELDLEFKSYSSKSQYLYFADNCVAVDAQSVTESRTPLNGHYVWDKHICPHYFRPLEPQLSIDYVDGEYRVKPNNVSSCYGRYLINTSRIHWRKELEERANGDVTDTQYMIDNKFSLYGPRLTSQEIAEQEQNFANKVFTVGYLMHRYKSASKAWCPFLMDGKVDAQGHSNGRSGKSFFFRPIEMFFNIAALNGRNKKLLENNHIYDRVTTTTDILLVDDLAKELDLTYFFDDITGTMVINPKRKDSFALPFDVSPKLAMTTNFVPFVFDGSTFGRLLMCVFSDWYHERSEDNDYHESRKIYDDFGFNLLDDYHEEHFNQDINFMINCLQFYLLASTNGQKINAPMGNILVRRLLQTMGTGFCDWADVYLSPEGGNLNSYINRQEALIHYQTTTLQKITSHKFGRSLKAYCELKGYELNPSELCNNGGRIIRKCGTVPAEYFYIKS